MPEKTEFVEKTQAKRLKKQEWVKNHYRVFVVKINRAKDNDIVEKLESQENITSYISDLIRKDMER